MTYEDLGGIEGILDDITELIVFPMAHPEVNNCSRKKVLKLQSVARELQEPALLSSPLISHSHGYIRST